MKKYCEKCGIEKDTRIVQQQEEYNVKGYPVTIGVTVRVCCDCNEPIWDDTLDDENLRSAFRKYREIKGLLMPEQIKSIREKYQVSQVAFAKILGLGEKTINRYENGSLQDEAQNNLILLMNDPCNFQTLLEKNKDKLNEDEIKGISIPSQMEATMPYKIKRNKGYDWRVYDNEWPNAS